MLGKLLKRIMCKMTICCKSKCSIEPSARASPAGEQHLVKPSVRHYDYYSNKEKQLV